MLGREAQLHAIDEAVPVVQWCLYLMEAASCCFVLEAALLTELYYLPPHPCFGALISPGLAPTGIPSMDPMEAWRLRIDDSQYPLHILYRYYMMNATTIQHSSAGPFHPAECPLGTNIRHDNRNQPTLTRSRTLASPQGNYMSLTPTCI